MTTWLNVKNNAESALASAITAAATSLTLVSGEGSKFPATNFNITIDDEILLCSSRAGDVLTVTRAQEGTTAAVHAAGAIVSLNVTAAVITQLQGAGDTLALGTLQSKLITLTRDLAAAPGDVAYTSVGFQPTALIILGALFGTDYWSIGVSDKFKGNRSIYNLVDSHIFGHSAYVVVLGSSVSNQAALVKSYDADGFTLTWTKNGTPGGLATIYVMCLR